MEENLRRSLLISDGSFSFLWDRPLTLCIMFVIISIIGWQIYRGFIKKISIGVCKLTTKNTNKMAIF